MQIPVRKDFDLLDLHERSPQRYPHLLQSAAKGEQGRFDILFACPGDSLTLLQQDEFDFLETLDARWGGECPSLTDDSDLPFRGGWFLYLSYELAAQIEPSLRLPEDSSGLPIAIATRVPAAVIHDHQNDARWIVAEQEALLDEISKDIIALANINPLHQLSPISTQVIEDDPQQYQQSVTKILSYIEDGDVFQVNLSRLWRAPWPRQTSTAVLYRNLRTQNPGPFNGLATWNDHAILSSSPERLVEVCGDVVQTRPIAGTRPRAEQMDADLANATELLEHPKERAEHIMLIDLERNDLGRIAIPGTVQVNELMSLESYATVHHIVSNVQARMRKGITPGAIIRAVFPGGTITGCPKVRCMEIIAELEGEGRGAYTGSMGYLNHDGSMDLNILIRTVVRSGEQLVFRAGAGIVADSSPQHELEETRAKAAGMLRALQERAP